MTVADGLDYSLELYTANQRCRLLGNVLSREVSVALSGEVVEAMT